MSRKSAYVGWFGRLNLPQISNEEDEEVKLEDFRYANDFIQYKIVRYITRNVPIRYTTVNYVKYPVEWKKSVRSAVIFKVAKKVNIERYCEIELLNLDIPDEFKWIIIERIGFIPTWQQKILDIKEVEGWISMHERAIVPLIDIKQEVNKIAKKFDEEIDALKNMVLQLKLLPTPVHLTVVRAMLTPFTLGLSWIGFVSKKTSLRNILQKRSHEESIAKKRIFKTNEIEKVSIDLAKKNSEILTANAKIESEIKHFEQKLQKIKNTNYRFATDDEGFIDLRKSLKTITKFEAKGIYIIWNKTKDKYYVGQSKDVYKRLFTQHFNNNDVKNIIFAKDWYADDIFFFKIIELETKDELDSMEKEYIEKYDSFKNGYNATGGNK